MEEIRSSFDPERPIPIDHVEFSGTVFAEFQLVIEDCENSSPGNVKKVLWPWPHTHSCPIWLDEIIPIVTSSMLKFVTSIICLHQLVLYLTVLNMLLSNLC